VFVNGSSWMLQNNYFHHDASLLSFPVLSVLRGLYLKFDSFLCSSISILRTEEVYGEIRRRINSVNVSYCSV
jgi:hypothetical protein